MSAERAQGEVVTLRPVGRCHPLDRTKFIALREDYLSLLETPLPALMLEAINGACSARMHHLSPTEQRTELALIQHDPQRSTLWVGLTIAELRDRTGFGGKRQLREALKLLEERGFILRRESSNAWSRSLEYLIQPHEIDGAILAPGPAEGPGNGLNSDGSDRTPGEILSDPPRAPIDPAESSDGTRREVLEEPSSSPRGAVEGSPGSPLMSDKEIGRDQERVGEPHSARDPRMMKLGVPGALTAAKLADLDERARQLVEEVVEGQISGVQISGGEAQKLAAVLLAELVERRKARGRPVWFQLPAVGLVIEDKLDSPARRELVQNLRGIGPLVLVGLEEARGRQQLTLLEAAIDTRVADDAIVIVAETRPGGVSRLPERLASTIGGYCKRFDLDIADEERWSA